MAIALREVSAPVASERVGGGLKDAIVI